MYRMRDSKAALSDHRGREAGKKIELSDDLIRQEGSLIKTGASAKRG